MSDLTQSNVPKISPKLEQTSETLLTDNYKTIVGVNIKRFRKQKHITQKELAEKIGYSESSICKYEQGLTDIPNVVIISIAAALDITPSDLFTTDDWSKKKDHLPTVSDIFEEIKSNMCDNYCKYSARYKDYDEMLEEVCSKCPLNRL